MDPTDLVEVDLQVEKTKKCLDRWMENLPEEAHSLPLHCLAIPGKNFHSIIDNNLGPPLVNIMFICLKGKYKLSLNIYLRRFVERFYL